MASTLLNADIILNEALRILENELAFLSNVDKQHDKETEIGGMKTGGSIKIRKPNQYTVRTGWTISAQDVVEESVTLTIGTVKGVDINFTESQLALNIKDFSKTFIEPAIIRLASEIDLLNFQAAYKDVYNLVGTAGTVPSSALVYLQAQQKMTEYAAPQSGRKCIIDPAAQAGSVNSLIPLFNPSAAIGKQYTSGQMGNALGFDFAVSQNVPVHTCGTRSGTILIDDAALTNMTEGTTTQHIDGLGGATQTVKEGDVFTIAGVYAVNPVTKQTLGHLQQFVVQADVAGSGSECDVTFLPAIFSTGARKTVSAMPADEAAVTFVGTASTNYAQNLAFLPEFFTFATANLEMPSDVHFKAQRAYKGINMRVLRQYDITNSNYPCRIDIFYGNLVQRPELACRITA